MRQARRSTAPADETRNDPDPPEAFELLADETRFAIVRALRDRGGGPLGYTDLREGAQISDSSRFNYHLMRLTGVLVDEVDDGYELRSDVESLLAVAFGPAAGGGTVRVREVGD